MPKSNVLKGSLKRKVPTDSQVIGLPSNALMPARYVDAETATHAGEKLKSRIKTEAVSTNSVHVKEFLSTEDKTLNQGQPIPRQHTLDNEENTLAASDSDVTAKDSDEDAVDSDATIPADDSRPKKRRRVCFYVIKEELSDTDEETDSKPVSNSNNAISQIRVKRELSYDSKPRIKLNRTNLEISRKNIPPLITLNSFEKNKDCNASHNDKSLLENSESMAAKRNSTAKPRVKRKLVSDLSLVMNNKKEIENYGQNCERGSMNRSKLSIQNIKPPTQSVNRTSNLNEPLNKKTEKGDSKPDSITSNCEISVLKSFVKPASEKEKTVVKCGVGNDQTSRNESKVGKNYKTVAQNSAIDLTVKKLNKVVGEKSKTELTEYKEISANQSERSAAVCLAEAEACKDALQTASREKDDKVETRFEVVKNNDQMMCEDLSANSTQAVFLQSESILNETNQVSNSPAFRSASNPKYTDFNALEYMKKGFSTHLLKYLNLNTKINKNDLLKCSNYVTAKCPKNKRFGLFYGADEIKTNFKHKLKNEKSGLHEPESKCVQFPKEASVACPVPLSANNSETICVKNSSESLVSIEELKKLIMEKTAIGSLQILFNSESKGVSEISFVHTSFTKDGLSGVTENKTLNKDQPLPECRSELQHARDSSENTTSTSNNDAITFNSSNSLSSFTELERNVENEARNTLPLVHTTKSFEINSDSRSIEESCEAVYAVERETSNASVAPTEVRVESAVSKPQQSNSLRSLDKLNSENCVALPSNEELSKIIFSSSLLGSTSNVLENPSNSANSPSYNVAEKQNESPSTNTVTENQTQLLSVPSTSIFPPLTIHEGVAAATDVEIELIKVKKKRNSFQRNIVNAPSQSHADEINNVDSFQLNKIPNASGQFEASETDLKVNSNKTEDLVNSKTCETEKQTENLEQNIRSRFNGTESQTNKYTKEIKPSPVSCSNNKGMNAYKNEMLCVDKHKKKCLSTVSECNKRIKLENSCLNSSTSNVVGLFGIVQRRNILDEIEQKKLKLSCDKTHQMEKKEFNRVSNIKDSGLNRTSIIQLNSELLNEKKLSTTNIQVNSGASAQSKDLCNCVITSAEPQGSANLKGKKSSVETITQTSKCNTNPEKSEEHCTKLLFQGRKGNQVILSKALYKDIGKHFISTNELPSLILEWNADWLITQKETRKCAPICDGYFSVKTAYANELDYYNTYFPLHLLSIWLRMSESWRKTSSFDSVFENQVNKASCVKITCSTVMSLTQFENWPRREDILLCVTQKRNGNVERNFGRVCNVMAKDYNPPANSCLQNKAGVLKRVKFEFFCAEVIEAPLLSKMKVQVLCNIRIALLQNDALQHLNNAMKEVILDSKNQGSRLSFISFQPHRDLTFRKCIQSIVDSIMSPTIYITLVDTSTHCDDLFAISQLVVGLKKHSSLLIALRSEDSFLKLANSFKSHNLILAVKKKEVKIPEELKKFTLEERLMVLTGREIFRKWHVTLTLLSKIFLGDFTDSFAEQNLICILQDAHLCTETETALLLYHDVKHLVLMGKHEIYNEMHSTLKRFGYNVSMFSRLYKAK